MKWLSCLVVLGFVGVSFAADPPKPGSPEWKRRFRELERRAAELRNRNGGSTTKTTRQPRDAAALEKRHAEQRKAIDDEYRAKMTPAQRRIYDDAVNPQPFVAEKAPTADRCLLMFRDALNKGTEFGVLLKCLCDERRKDWVMRQVNPNHLRFGQSEREYMASWRRVVGHVKRVDSVRKVSGVEGWVDVWAWVEAPGLSPGMYRFRMSGEGRFYRVREYKADYVRVR